MQGMSLVLSSLGLSRNPFPPTPDASSYFFTAHLQTQFSEVQHCIEARKGFVLVTGEVGLGKSTLVRRLLRALPVDQTVSALLLNTFLQEADLLAAILRDFGLQPQGSLDADLSQLNTFLLAQHAQGRTCLLIIDDAQNLSVASLELVRLLCNLETAQEKLLQILLVGQPELEATLAQPVLRQLRSRIVKHARLQGLRRDEVSRYFDFRVTASGGVGSLALDPAAARQLHSATGGNVRQVHLVLDRCLYGLSATQQVRIKRPLLNAALRELSLQSAVRKPLWRSVGALAAGFFGVAAVVAAAALSPVSSTEAPVHVSGPGMGGPSSGAQSDVCMDALQQKFAGGTVMSQAVSAPLATALKSSSEVCFSTHHDATWVTWVAEQPRPKVDAANNDETTLAVQSQLAHLGLLASSQVDGLAGPRTRAAIRVFQAHYKLSPTGDLDGLTRLLLEQPHGR